jgi:hypothetical protein
MFSVNRLSDMLNPWIPPTIALKLSIVDNPQAIRQYVE